jgi:uncharacterized membrane protein YphA (DoxX/SURF4 family)
MSADKQVVQAISFWKSISIFGGMLMVFVFGPGRLSVDRS